MGDEFEVRAEDLTHGSNYKVECECDYCGKITHTTYNLYWSETDGEQRKYACLDCRFEKAKETNSLERGKYFNQFLELCKERGYVPVSTLEDYTGMDAKLKYICPKHGLKEITLANLKHGKGCKECATEANANKHRLTPKEVKKIVESKNGNKLLNPEEYVDCKTKNLKVKCGTCGKIFITSLDSIKNGDGACRDCRNKKISVSQRAPIQDIITEIESKNGNKLLNPEDYTDAHNSNLQVQCGSCGGIFITSYNNYKFGNITGGCPDCNSKGSIGEKLISEFLDSYEIPYIPQYKFPNCKDIRPLPFDFYLPDYNLCIEFDGRQHFEPGFGEETFEHTVLHDNIKNDFCEKENIDLLRIPYYQISKLEKILTAKLDL